MASALFYGFFFNYRFLCLKLEGKKSESLKKQTGLSLSRASFCRLEHINIFLPSIKRKKMLGTSILLSISCHELMGFCNPGIAFPSHFLIAEVTHFKQVKVIAKVGLIMQSF